MADFSKKFDWLEKSEIRNMSLLCEKKGGINLAQGVCDLPISKVISLGARKAIKNGKNQYSSHEGVEELRKFIAQKAKKFNKINCRTENIIVSSGATGAFLCTCLALLEEGSEVIIFEPYYSYHESTIKAAGCFPKFVKLKGEGLSFDMSDLESAVTPKSKAILVNTPHNPTGKVFSREELEQIADFSIKHDLLVITDEIYEYFTYGNVKHISPASLTRIADRTISISGFSKVFSITGWRLGYCIAPAAMAQRIGYLSDLIYICAPTPLQYGVAAGARALDSNFYADLRNRYQHKRDLVCSALTKANFHFIKPQGAYYIMVDATHIPGKSGREKAQYFLEKSGVALVDGESFYRQGGENYLRLCFAKNDSILKEASRKIINYSKKYAKKR